MVLVLNKNLQASKRETSAATQRRMEKEVGEAMLFLIKLACGLTSLQAFSPMVERGALEKEQGTPKHYEEDARNRDRKKKR